MEPQVILLPVFAMISLTALVWATLYVQRISEMSRKHIDAEQLSSTKAASALLFDQRASDNFRNLFELPVLFYVGALFAYATVAVDVFVVGLAWAFVALRAAHSIVHCSYNRVMHRFVAYALSTLVLWALWARLAFVWFT